MAQGHDHDRGDETFECDCGETFETEDALKEHARTEHDADA